MKDHWKYIVISLIIGSFLGSALTMAAARRYRYGGFEKRFSHMRERLHKDLQLTPEQKAKMETIMKTSREKMEALRKSTREDIRKILNPTQQSTFDAQNAKMDARRAERMKRFQKLHD